MPTRLSLVMLTLSSSLILMMGAAQADQAPAFSLAKNSAMENTHRNVRDQNNATLTPEDQKETKGDLRITAHIRRMLVRNKALSTDAQNVKIITRNGRVTLRGPVENRTERRKLVKIAKHTRGVIRVISQLEIKAP